MTDNTPSDYSNSHKSKEEAATSPGTEAPKEKTKPKVERIVEGEVIVQKRGIGWKAKDFVNELDAKGVASYVWHELAIPRIKNGFFDLIVGGAARTIFKQGRPVSYQAYQQYQAQQQHNANRTTYNTMSNDPRLPQGVPRDPRLAPPVETGPRMSVHRDLGLYIVPTKEDADRVLAAMADILNEGYFVTVLDLNEMTGRPTEEWTNQRFGWTHIAGATSRQIREGWLLELPPVEVLP